MDHDYLWRAAKAAAGPGDDRDLQPLLLRGGPRRPGPPGDPGGPEAAALGQAQGSGSGAFARSTTGSATSSTTGIRIVKLFLNVSKEEQRQRFLARIDEPEKNWKFSAGDARERRYWDDYQRAFEDVLSKTSTEHAPWYVIPADRKWFMRIAAGAVILQALLDIDPKFPVVSDEAKADMAAAKAELLAEG